MTFAPFRGPHAQGQKMSYGSSFPQFLLLAFADTSVEALALLSLPGNLHGCPPVQWPHHHCQFLITASTPLCTSSSSTSASLTWAPSPPLFPKPWSIFCGTSGPSPTQDVLHRSFSFPSLW